MVQNDWGLNWQIFFTAVGACLQAGLRKSMRQQERQTDRLECNKTEVSLERNRDKESGTDMLNMWCILGEGGRSG